MGYSILEKILISHLENKKLSDFIYPKIDFCFGNDITFPLAVKEFNKAGFNVVFDQEKIGIICDHFVPARDFKAANNVVLLKDFSQKFNLKNFFDINEAGIEHIFLIEKKLVKPLDLVIGADSHTCTLGGIGIAAFGVGSTDLAVAMREGRVWLKRPSTFKFIYKGKIPSYIDGKDLILYTISKIGVDGALYRVMEFTGEVIKKLNVEERLTITNMAVEAGAKTGIIEPDEKTVDYLNKNFGYKLDKEKLKKFFSDKDADYEKIFDFEISKLEPQVACPHLPSNVKTVSELKNVKLDQVFIGSCTNGRLSDLRKAAKILKGKKVKKGLRVIISPATSYVYRQAEKEGLMEIFLEAGCIIGPWSCGPCLGGHCGILTENEVSLSTTNRNFIGRMGDPKSFVYLSNAYVAAASAIKGRITHPAEVI